MNSDYEQNQQGLLFFMISIPNMNSVTPQKYPRIFFYNFIIYFGYKLSQRGYFLGIVK